MTRPAWTWPPGISLSEKHEQHTPFFLETELLCRNALDYFLAFALQLIL